MFAVLAGVAAFALTFAASYSCQFWFFEEPNPFSYDEDMHSYPIPVQSYMGIFTYRAYASYEKSRLYSCVPYTREQLQFLDQPFRVAYACAIVAIVFTGVSMLLLLKVSSCAVPKSFLTAIGVLSIGGCMFMAFTFYSCNSSWTDYNAVLSKDSTVAIASCVMSIVTSVLTFMVANKNGTPKALVAEPDRATTAKATTESA